MPIVNLANHESLALGFGVAEFTCFVYLFRSLWRDRKGSYFTINLHRMKQRADGPFPYSGEALAGKGLDACPSRRLSFVERVNPNRLCRKFQIQPLKSQIQCTQFGPKPENLS
jgi:hypothetical protein